MKTALIVMTILGCDDSVSECKYISTISGTWQSVATCDAESQKQLPKFSNSNYPVVVALCETSAESLATANVPSADSASAPVPLVAPKLEPLQTTAAPAQAQERPALPRRALALVTGALPDLTKLRTAVTTPVHSIQNGYSWVARKFSR